VIAQEATHPNGVNSTPGEEHWTVRRWTSDRDGQVLVRYLVRKENPNGPGVTAYLFHNDEALDRVTIHGHDSIGCVRQHVVEVARDDTIDLALGPAGVCRDPNDGSDGSFNWMQIDTVPAVVELAGRTVADSQLDWSIDGTQGAEGWSYGYYDQRLDVEKDNGIYDAGTDFVPFLNDGTGIVSADPTIGAWRNSPNHWDGVKWDLLNNAAPVSHGPWTEITCPGGHPAANAQMDPEVQWAIRRWTSDIAGEVIVSGFFKNLSAAGDGVAARVLHNGAEVFAGVSNGTPQRFEVRVTVAVDDVLDFAIDADGAGNLDPSDPATLGLVNDGSDGTVFLITIEEPGTAGPPLQIFHRGDPMDTGSLNLTNGIAILNWLFLGGPDPVCFDAADVDNDGQINLSDGVNIFNFLFLGGPPPRPPGPVTEPCGPDPDADNLDCGTYSHC
jgi:hypothetical protein